MLIVVSAISVPCSPRYRSVRIHVQWSAACHIVCSLIAQCFWITLAQTVKAKMLFLECCRVGANYVTVARFSFNIALKHICRWQASSADDKRWPLTSIYRWQALTADKHLPLTSALLLCHLSSRRRPDARVNKHCHVTSLLTVEKHHEHELRCALANLDLCWWSFAMSWCDNVCWRW